MKFTIVTLFPEAFSYLDSSIIKRACEKGKVEIEFVNPRDFTTDKHRQVDDYPYGGGVGMVIKPEPVYAAVEAAKRNNSLAQVIMTTPRGVTLSQNLIDKLSTEKELIMLCGHYEDFDQRVYALADYQISLGDFVLTGGELPAMVIIDAITRLLPGVIVKTSAACDSFRGNLLDYPHYTRPPVFRGMEVPEVLTSGHHEKIERWRRKQSLKNTMLYRPDLLEKAELSSDALKIVHEIISEEYEPPPEKIS
ncbi:MAG: tRNA (guanosine(37)-N1)-methyltransferase TrmD [Vulcanimicrobiota bacterium]